jgi:hypothetical protein
MFTSNPFAEITAFLPPVALQAYIVLMILAVAIGTVFDVLHKRSGIFFARQKQKAKAAATRQLTGADIASIAARTIASEVAASGEFRAARRVSHLLMSYGFLLYLVTTIVMIFAYPTDPYPPTLLPVLWNIGLVMVLIGGYWFFLFLRVDVSHERHSVFRLVRADLFIVTLLASLTFALIWEIVQSMHHMGAASLFFGLYIFFTTLLFVSVPWSKFAHMFFKPVVAFQRRVEEASGSSSLPAPADVDNIRR